MGKPLKRAKTVTELIQQLRCRGMEIDGPLAVQWLSNVSYYRLSAYWYPARQLGPDSHRSDAFVPGTVFADAVRLYEADRKLRTLVHDGMERIEVGLRTRVGERLCVNGPLSYTRPDQFRPTFNHAEWMLTARKRISRAAKHNEAIKHHMAEYGNQYPFWVLAEVLDFADMSRLYEGMRARDQLDIAEGFGIRVNMAALSRSQQQRVKTLHPLVRWMEQFTVVRNTCAHHSRLWNKSFTPVPTAALRTSPHFALLPPGQSERVFGTLTVMSQLLRVTSPGTAWPTKVVRLLRDEFLDNPLVSPPSLGIPDDWSGDL